MLLYLGLAGVFFAGLLAMINFFESLRENGA